MADPHPPDSSASGSRPAPSRMASFSGIEFVPKRAMQSFENLVALANYEERLREARKIVWRDKGEKPAEVLDLLECIEHAGRGGFSACASASSARSELTLCPPVLAAAQEPAHSRLPSARA